ncbi:type II toxin-antitoxin system RelE/ParE family toxin [Algoriphagus formosus]|uniref:Type II toxin-antitoxin system RelE/ParE family toxin n=1 Tax=Algoriphagus formosus TaxID=2007308 RepID=A0A4R5UWQ2_9BACT|nr:type II toxin-antitoxin system RelE/ParE family toxin [Algoriphagus aquimaris]
MVQIRWTHQSVKDLSDIFEYISIDSEKYAKRQIVRIKARTQILKTNPMAGKIVPELPQRDFRELIEGNYRIIYKILNDNRIDILTIHHSARDLSRRKI